MSTMILSSTVQHWTVTPGFADSCLYMYVDTKHETMSVLLLTIQDPYLAV